MVYDKDPDVLELLSSDSRYLKNSHVVDYNGNRMYDIPYLASINNTTNDEYIVVTSKYQDRFDKISSDKYSNPKLWWVLADLNDIDSPFSLDLNKVLRVPQISKLLSSEVI